MKDFLLIVIVVTVATVIFFGVMWLLTVIMSIGGPFATLGVAILLISLFIFYLTRLV